jgi:hypothetical protein
MQFPFKNLNVPIDANEQALLHPAGYVSRDCNEQSEGFYTNV